MRNGWVDASAARLILGNSAATTNRAIAAISGLVRAAEVGGALPGAMTVFMAREVDESGGWRERRSRDDSGCERRRALVRSPCRE
ncbi:hypothetical protein X946_5440 [Burkholderia sp. ABCPW 111]|nr:hypothetical protein X946_5440 [Burkholderia sp. ABCPW 111]